MPLYSKIKRWIDFKVREVRKWSNMSAKQWLKKSKKGWRREEPIRPKLEQLDFAPKGASSESSLRPRLARTKPSRLIESPSPHAGEVWTWWEPIRTNHRNFNYHGVQGFTPGVPVPERSEELHRAQAPSGKREWWRWRELNPRPRNLSTSFLHV